MTKRKRQLSSGCISCGKPCTLDAVDNMGKPYKGCATCRFPSFAITAYVSDYSRGKADGAAEERARVVAWLRTLDCFYTTIEAAKDIEDGEHSGILGSCDDM